MDVNVDNSTNNNTTTTTSVVTTAAPIVITSPNTNTPSMSSTISPDLNQHYQQHFQQHYASTNAQEPTETQQQQPQQQPQSQPQPQPQPQQKHKSMITFNPNVSSSSSSSVQQQQQQQQQSGGSVQVPVAGGGSMNDSYESQFQVIERDPFSGNVRKIEEKREQHSKRTTQTTTTTTSTSQPMLLNTADLQGPTVASVSPVHFADSHAHLTYVQQPVPVYAIATGPCLPIPVVPAPMPLALPPPPPPVVQPVSQYTTTSGNITVEHYSSGGHFSWTNADTYMHIFLTFYFGHFAAMLFFDGIIRNFVALYLFEHTNWSMLIYILHIILSIALLAFCVWFLTICWRWWRNKSLLPMYGLPYYDYNQRPLGPKERQATFHGCVFTAALILIISFFCYLVLGVLDLNFKRNLQSYYYSSSSQPNSHYHKAAYYGDLVVFILRLVFWIVGIVVTLLLSRDILFKFCCPERRIRIDKERPTTVYEVRRPSPNNTNTATNNNNNNPSANINNNNNNNINITASA